MKKRLHGKRNCRRISKDSIAIAKAASENPELAASLGSDYIIKPDVVVFRQLVTDSDINRAVPLVDDSVALMSSLMFYTQSQLANYAAMLNLNLPPNHPFLAQIAQREQDFLYVFVLVGIVQFALFNATAVFLSHRIAGPLHRLERHLEEVAAGNEPKDVKFRKGDLYQSLAEACNRLMARMRASPVKP